MTGTLGVIAGLTVGGIVVAAGGGMVALAINATSFLLSALVLLFVREPTRTATVRSAKAHLAAGVAALRNDPFLWRAAWLTTVANVPAMAVESSAAAYGRFVLHGSPAIVGLLLVSVPVADFIATALCPRTGGPEKLMRRASFLAAFGGIVGIIGFTVGHLFGAVLGFAGAGVVFALIAPGQSAVGPRIPAADRSGTFGLLQGSLSGAQAAGATIGGLCAAEFGARLADLGAMGLALAVGAIALGRPVTDCEPVACGDVAAKSIVFKIAQAPN
jgi:hypothetical protein